MFLKLPTVCLLIGLIAQQWSSTAAKGETTTSLKCFQCDTQIIYNCLDLYTVMSTVCPADSTKCFTKNVDGGIKRGCLKDSDTTTCPDGESNCLVCSESGCNNHRICKKCTTNDTKCSQTDAYDVTYNQICEASDTKCFVNVKDGKVERRCANHNDTCAEADSTTCSLCGWTNCNASIFPTKRIQCYQCSGPECNTVTTSHLKSIACPTYIDGDKCYSQGQNATSMKRGCLSETDAETGSPADFVTCNTNHCNRFPYERNQTIKCIQCSGSGKDADCLQEQVVEAAKTCREKLLYGDIDSCFTLQKGVSIRRGCLNDDPKVKEECTSPEWCKTCEYGHGCNRQEESVPFTCIVCRSDMNKDCWNDAHKIDGHRCRTAESSEEEGCFHGIWGDVVIRGCATDADEQMTAVCQDPYDNQCHICWSKDCNTGQSSGVGRIIFKLGLLIVSPIVMWAISTEYS